MRYPILFSLALALMIAGCGGGGGGGSDDKNDEASTGNDSGADNNPQTPAAVQNQLKIVVERGPANRINVPFVSLTICRPGTSNCQTIDHVILDTGSAGLRLVSSALDSALALPASQTADGRTLGECLQFVSSYSWGTIRTADVKIAGHTLEALPIQVIGDTTAGAVPSSCANAGGTAANTVQTLGGNGVLGVSVFAYDCGSVCASSAISGMYYACSSATCSPAAVALAKQVANPVARLASDNNGVVVDLPGIGSTGAASVTGTLTLGIGTQTNNALGSATVLGLSASAGTLTTRFDGVDYKAFFDTGSNGLYFPSNLTECSGLYCPATTQHLSAVNTGTNGVASTVDFDVGNARTLVNTGNVAFNNLGGTAVATGYFDWGLPFYFGRKVFTAIEGKSTPGGTGPYIAY